MDHKLSLFNDICNNIQYEFVSVDHGKSSNVPKSNTSTNTVNKPTKKRKIRRRKSLNEPPTKKIRLELTTIPELENIGNNFQYIVVNKETNLLQMQKKEQTFGLK